MNTWTDEQRAKLYHDHGKCPNCGEDAVFYTSTPVDIESCDELLAVIREEACHKCRHKFLSVITAHNPEWKIEPSLSYNKEPSYKPEA